jgi:asparagine synthase (glutamine-hydrolysing)
VCGIAGKIDFSGPVDADIVLRMCGSIRHRGPDSQGTFVKGGVGLGTQRLAIIDVAGGDQPISNEDGSVVLVQNGEIYNYLELRDQLTRRGHRFTTDCDTEVLVHLYEEHGEAMVHRLRGMFAFVLWDERRRQLFCARDRVGKKPLFWARTGPRFWFASELAALLEDPALDRELDYRALASYLTLEYVPHPLSAFAAIRKLPPACTLTVSEQGERIDRYWSLDYSSKLAGVPSAELEERLWAELREATRIRLMSEVPLGVFLSGGLDSSAIVAAMAQESAQPVKTFSIGFSDKSYDELAYARRVAEHFATEHHEFRVEPDALAILPKLVRHFGEPFADPAAVPTFYLAELARRHVTVALNGDGGDESFAGYQRYVAAPSRLDRVPRSIRRVAPLIAGVLPDGAHPSSFRTRVKRLSEIVGMSFATRYATRIGAFDATRRERLFTPEFAAAVNGARPEAFVEEAWGSAPAGNPVDRLLATDVATYLPDDLLVKVDIASMACSLEARSPFLDHHLMEFAASLPPEQKLERGATKVILKRALRRVIPPEILDRPKQGFSVPLAQWFRNELRDLPTEILLDPRAIDRGYFRRDEVEDIIREHRDGIANHSRRLWVLLQFELWHREVVEPAGRFSRDPPGG